MIDCCIILPDFCMILYSLTELVVHAFTVQVTQEALSCRELTRMDNLIFLVCTVYSYVLKKPTKQAKTKPDYNLQNLQRFAQLNKGYSSNLSVFGKNKLIFKGSLEMKSLHCLHSLLL